MNKSHNLALYARACGVMAIIGMVSNTDAIWQATFAIMGVVFAVGSVILKEFGR